MYTTITLISLLNYIGTTAFIIEGIFIAQKMRLHYFLQFLSGMSTAFFGEIFLRDLILLQTTPAIFQCPLGIAAATLICIFTIIISKHREPGNISLSILCLLDSIGVVGSVAAGYTQSATRNVLIAFICGFITACGGDIIATAIQTMATKNLKAFFTLLTGHKWYYLFTASISIIYSIMYLTGHDTNSTIMTLTFIAIIIGFIIKSNNVN